MLRPARLALTTAAVLVPIAVATGSGAPPAPVAAPVVSDPPVAAPAAPATLGATPPPTVAPSALAAMRRTPLAESGAVDAADIPLTALAAYQRAVTVVSQVDASCGLTWELLAAVGRVESDHGRTGGSTLGADGTSSPRIRGPVLDGTGPLAAVTDSDAGGVDGNDRWDRAVGPMQFLPSTWTVVGVDADGDGARSADDLDDAALGAAVYLCAGSEDLATADGARSALLRYNPSAAYATRVLEVAHAYEQGRAPVPTVTPVETTAARQHPSETSDRPPRHAHPDTAVFAVEHPAGGAKPAKPPTPQPPPFEPAPAEPTPEPTPEPVVLAGLLAPCVGDADAWCVGDDTVDLGDAAHLAAPALADLDADGVVESNREEITGLVGTQVTVVVAGGTAPARVVEINGMAYADQPVAR
ncbi:lytic transglycosylase domain-containing protein [Nocardioides conyzicola]|uniref:Transglycosylase SLT domain-containing protein n=1 Tax=Nocardioides conyzicola TaxID=1651781 RepID=A0ABP8WXE4_9ACTN